MVYVKSKRELDIMREAGRRLSTILSRLASLARPGMTLIELDREAERLTLEADSKPAFKGYHGFRHTLCTSVNEQVVHGIPSDRKLVEGDIVGIDYGLVYQGFYSDSAVTVPIGNVSAEAKKLMKVTASSLYAAIEASQSGNTLKDLARAVEGVIKPHGYGIVREFVGHGIGQKLHEDPQIPNYEAGASLVKLRPGMTIAIEPMVNVGTHEVKVLSDRWTAVTVDGKLSAHFEHSIAITENGPEILTDWEDDGFRKVAGLI